MPPVRGTGRSCSERSLGRSSAKPAKRPASRRAAMNATMNDETADPASIGAILTAQIPLRRGAQALFSREGRFPAQRAANRRIVDFERAGQLVRKQCRRKTEQPFRPPERRGDFGTKLRRGYSRSVGNQERALRLQAGEHGGGEVADVYQASSIVDRRQG